MSITRNKSKKIFSKRKISLKKSVCSKTQEGPLTNMVTQEQKIISKVKKKNITKRNISGLKKIASTSTCVFPPPNKSNITNYKNATLNQTIEKNSKCSYVKLVSLKALKKQILMGPLMIPNSFFFPHKENQNQNGFYMNKKIKTNANSKTMNRNNNIYNNYLSHKTSFSEVNSIFLYNNSMSNCNTTCNTHTNSNNKSNSFSKSILKKKSENFGCSRINKAVKSKNFEEKNPNPNTNSKEEGKDNKNKNLYIIGEYNNLINSDSCDNFEIKSEKYINNAEEYIEDILDNLLRDEKEAKLKIDPNYFKIQPDINSKMRAILIDWLIDVHLKFNFKQETLYITIYIIDTYLSKEKIERCNFQLLGVTALSIACKQNEILFRKLNEYVYITDNAYTEQDIKDMEEKILKTLDFNILFPSSLTFFEILSNKLELNNDKFHFGEFLMESFYLDENCLKYSASTVACAVGYIVMKYFKKEKYKECYNPKIFNIKPINELVEKYSRSSNYHIYIIKECAKDICNFMNELGKSNLKSTIRKFSTDNFSNVTKLLYGNLKGIN